MKYIIIREGENMAYEEIENNSYIHDKCTKSECSKVSCQYADITLPVEIKPDAKVGEIKLECCGEPSVTCKKGQSKDVCEIKINQKICVKIPICYKVETCVGNKNICCNCNDKCCE